MLKLFAISPRAKSEKSAGVGKCAVGEQANKRKVQVGKTSKAKFGQNKQTLIWGHGRAFKKEQFSATRNDHDHKERLLNATGQRSPVRNSSLIWFKVYEYEIYQVFNWNVEYTKYLIGMLIQILSQWTVAILALFLYFNSCENDEYASGDCDDKSFQSTKSCNGTVQLRLMRKMWPISMLPIFSKLALYIFRCFQIETLMKLCKFYFAKIHIC